MMLVVEKGRLVARDVPAPDKLAAIGARRQKDAWVLPPHVRARTLAEVYQLSCGDDVAAYEEHWANVAALKSLPDIDVPVEISPRLDGYQRVGAMWLASVKRGILADGLGLGKTAQAIAATDIVGAKRVLVITKKSLLTHWLTEIERFSSNPDAAIFLSGHKVLPQTRYIVTNYDACTRRSELMQESWDVVIVDEATAIKNRKAKRTQAIWAICRRAEYVWLLAGVLIRNSVDEVWALLHALDPVLYSSYWDWRRRHCIEEPVYRRGMIVSKRVVGVANPKLLQAELDPWVLARDKATVQLPPLTREMIWVGMTEEQQRVYQELKEWGVAEIGSVIQTPVNAMELLLRMREAACDVRISGHGGGPGEKTMAAIELLISLVEDGHRVLVFSNWRRYVDLLLQSLHGVVRALPYHGGMSHVERDAAQQAFDAGKADVLVATIPAAGEGLNLQTADTVLFLDRPWVPADVEQAEGRVWRRGQTRPVHVINLLTKGTVEEYVEEVLRGKLTQYEAVRVAKKLLASG